MQKRPEYNELYSLNKRISGTLKMGGRDVWFSSGNYIDFEGGRNNLHRHSYYEVCIVLAGRGVFDCGDSKIPLNQGDLFIADPGIVHEIISDENPSLKIQFISFSFSRSDDETGMQSSELYDLSITEFMKNHSRVMPGCDILAGYFEDLKTASQEENSLKWYLRSEAIVRMIILDVIFLSTGDSVFPGTSLPVDQRLDMAIKYIEDNSFRKLKIEEIASHACTSTRTLRRLMREAEGMRVTEKCSRIRIDASARYLLMHPETTVKEVSYRFGFQNPSDYCRLFSKMKGIPPGLFRERKGTVFT